MKFPFQVLSYSIPKQNKIKNGDCFVTKILEKENLLLAIVADGVSQQPCDWKASKTTCESIVYFFERSNVTNLKERLSESILLSNQKIISEGGKCHKMASTLSLFLWDFNFLNFYTTNVGDSRIYRITQNSVKLLTKDDSSVKKELISSSKSTQLIKSQMLNRVMGQDNLEISVETHSLQNNDVIILATDGFYDARKATFNKKMIELAESLDFQSHFQKTVKSFEIFRGDDMTTVAIKILTKHIK